LPEKISIIQVGGSVERAVKGDYHLDVKSILTEAWQLTLKSRLTINVGLLFSMALAFIIALVISRYLGGIEAVLADQQASMWLNITLTIAVWPFIAAVEMMGILHAVGMKTHPKMIFSFLKRASWVVLCALLSSTLIQLGLELFILPGIFFAVTLSLSIPLVIEKKMSPMKAISLSVQALRFKLLPLFSIYFILFMILLTLLTPLAALIESELAPIGVVLFIFGCTYLAPLFYNVKGILYREIFGVSVATDKVLDPKNNNSDTSVTNSTQGSDDTFSA